MTDIYGTLRLRPTRIGFLVRPRDFASVVKIMRASTCLWGGQFNPIIPVFRVPPNEWRAERHEGIKGLAVAQGYIRFFEPDVFVEAEEGLAEQAGLAALREKYTLSKQVVTLGKFLEPQEHRDWAKPAFGLPITDVMNHLYSTTERFQQRNRQPSALFKSQPGSGLVEAVFGAYPRESDASYFQRDYAEVFQPTEMKADEDAWVEVFKKGTFTPLRLARAEVEVTRYWRHDAVIFVFDPRRSTDLIDLWNLRLEPKPVFPVPIEWVEKLTPYIQELILAEHRPVQGNPNGIMHQATLEFARSINKEKAEKIAKGISVALPAGALAVKYWRTRIWVPQPGEHVFREARMAITGVEQWVSLTVKGDGELATQFEPLSPKFASQFGLQDYRWVNALSVRGHAREDIATVFPFNTFDRRWPRFKMGSERVIIGSEGWVFGQRYKNTSESITFLSKEEAIIGSLKRSGIEAKLSPPGHIAKQMLAHLGGLWGVHLLADLNTLQLLNNMAGGVRRKSNGVETVEETFELRSAPLRSWTSLVAKRKEEYGRLELSDFTKRNIIRLGLESECSHCEAKNWHSLTATDYQLTCERCLKTYDFPQARLRDQNRNWYYRVVGPFSVPDYGRGSYGSLLALRALSTLRSSDSMTFSTAMELKFDGIDAEADFLILRQRGNPDEHNSPDLIVGEAKSLGQGDLLKSNDLRKLKDIGRKLPGAILVVSVLRDHFTASEKKLLVSFVRWARRPDDEGRPTNPVILMTANELFVDHLISAKWKKLGKPYDAFADFYNTNSLRSFAEATQRIYLGLPGFYEERAAARKRQNSARGAPPPRSESADKDSPR